MAKKVNREKYENIAVAIDKDKGSQYGLKWAVDNILGRNQSLTLVHVKQKSGSIPTPLGSHDVVDENGQTKRFDAQTNELFLPYRCFCKRKEIKCNEVVVEETDIVKGLIDYVNTNGVDALVFGSASRGGFMRFKSADIPGNVSKLAPDFCTVYTVLKGKLSSVRKATAPVPVKSVPKAQPLQNKPVNVVPEVMELPYKPNSNPQVTPFAVTERATPYSSHSFPEETDFRSPFTRGRGSLAKSFESSLTEADISFVSTGRPSTDRMFPSFYEGSESGMTPRLSNSSDYDYRSFGSLPSVNNSVDMSSQQDFSSTSIDSGRMSWSQQKVDDVEAEMSRLRLELKQTMDMYSSACKEALTAKQKARELHFWKMEEQQKLEDARSAEEAALALVEKEKAKCKAAIEAAQAAQKIAELEAQKRMNAEFRALREAEEKKAALQSLNRGADLRYRRYAIEEIEAATHNFSNSLKIGEGGYGPVYKAYLDHTSVAIKVLRPDAAQGRSQFQQEVEVLSCIRHPNMVLLLGACPEFGCLVYECMANGSLDDRLCRRGNTPPLSWQLRFKIAAEIGTGLLFLHQTKPEPLVHRDLKPGNILLDRNFVSKISDVGLARLVPPSIVDSVTQYRMTSTAGTFCYIDPEYQQTGMLGTKSDIYSLGIMFLQIITSRPPMGLTHQVERSIEKGTFREILDPAVPDWPVEEAMSFAKLALKCAELRKKDRPDLGKVILPELDRLRALAEDNMSRHSSPGSSPNHSFVPFLQEVMSDQPSGFDSSSRSRSSTSSST